MDQQKNGQEPFRDEISVMKDKTSKSCKGQEASSDLGGNKHLGYVYGYEGESPADTGKYRKDKITKKNKNKQIKKTHQKNKNQKKNNLEGGRFFLFFFVFFWFFFLRDCRQILSPRHISEENKKKNLPPSELFFLVFFWFLVF